MKDQIDQYKSRLREAERVSARSALLPKREDGTTNLYVSQHITEASVAEQETRTFDNTEGKLNEYINIGTNALESLRTQRHIIKSAQKRILDVGTSMGISQSVMRMISRKSSRDRLIFYGGVFVVLLVVYFCYKFI